MNYAIFLAIGHRLLVHFCHKLLEADVLNVGVPAEDWTPTAQDTASQGFNFYNIEKPCF